MKTLAYSLALATLFVTASTALAQSNYTYNGQNTSLTGYSTPSRYQPTTPQYTPQYTPNATPQHTPNPTPQYVANYPAASTVKGPNVSMVIYSCNGQICGTFIEVGQGRWMERNSDGLFEFTEIGRDEWSVYLRKTDGAQVQLDLHRKTVSINQFDLYSIVTSAD